jgi:uncharacterized protein YdhG (YjbR/CyaY superfamily)
LARLAPSTEYLATLDDDARRTLQSVRASIQKAAPKAEETISYGFPAFRLNGKLRHAFEGPRRTARITDERSRVDANRGALAGYDTSKGTIRFPTANRCRRVSSACWWTPGFAEMGAAPAKKAARNAATRQAATPATASPEAAIKGFLAKYDPAIAAQLKACRKKIRALVPRGFEMVYDNYNALVFGFSPTGRASDALLSVIGYPRWVSVAFLQGASVADPDGLLRGTGNQVRGLRLGAPTDLDDPKVQALITRALSASRAEFAAAPPLRTVVKSVSAKQRSRR